MKGRAKKDTVCVDLVFLRFRRLYLWRELWEASQSPGISVGPKRPNLLFLMVNSSAFVFEYG